MSLSVAFGLGDQVNRALERLLLPSPPPQHGRAGGSECAPTFHLQLRSAGAQVIQDLVCDAGAVSSLDLADNGETH